MWKLFLEQALLTSITLNQIILLFPEVVPGKKKTERKPHDFKRTKTCWVRRNVYSCVLRLWSINELSFTPSSDKQHKKLFFCTNFQSIRWWPPLDKTGRHPTRGPRSCWPKQGGTGVGRKWVQRGRRDWAQIWRRHSCLWCGMGK